MYVPQTKYIAYWALVINDFSVSIFKNNAKESPDYEHGVKFNQNPMK